MKKTFYSQKIANAIFPRKKSKYMFHFLKYHKELINYKSQINFHQTEIWSKIAVLNTAAGSYVFEIPMVYVKL